VTNSNERSLKTETTTGIGVPLNSLRPVVELLNELPQVDPELAQRRPDRRGRSRLAAGNLELRLAHQLLCHRVEPLFYGSWSAYRFWTRRVKPIRSANAAVRPESIDRRY
jgi:hypothetical protein